MVTTFRDERIRTRPPLAELDDAFGQLRRLANHGFPFDPWSATLSNPCHTPRGSSAPAPTGVFSEPLAAAYHESEALRDILKRSRTVRNLP